MHYYNWYESISKSYTLNKNHWRDQETPWSRCCKRNSLSNEGIFIILPSQYFPGSIKRYVKAQWLRVWVSVGTVWEMSLNLKIIFHAKNHDKITYFARNLKMNRLAVSQSARAQKAHKVNNRINQLIPVGAGPFKQHIITCVHRPLLKLVVPWREAEMNMKSSEWWRDRWHQDWKTAETPNAAIAFFKIGKGVSPTQCTTRLDQWTSTKGTTDGHGGYH